MPGNSTQERFSFVCFHFGIGRGDNQADVAAFTEKDGQRKSI